VVRAFWLGFTGSMIPVASQAGLRHYLRKGLRPDAERRQCCFFKAERDAEIDSSHILPHRHSRNHAIIVTLAQLSQTMTKGDAPREWTLNIILISGLVNGNATGNCMRTAYVTEGERLCYPSTHSTVNFPTYNQGFRRMLLMLCCQ
jgi:hypothetical protein